MVKTSEYLEGYFHSMLTYFRGIDRPPDHILVLKLKELLLNLINSDPLLAAYFKSLTETDKLSIKQIMERNYCFKLRIEDLSHFSRVFKKITGKNPTEYKKSLAF